MGGKEYVSSLQFPFTWSPGIRLLILLQGQLPTVRDKPNGLSTATAAKGSHPNGSLFSRR